MADKVSRLAPTGNMDKDSDVRYVGKGERKGDYIDARNIQIAQDSGGSAGDAVPTLGTQFGFNLGEVQAQSKKYKVTVDGDATKSHSITFLSTKRDYRITTGTGPNGEVEFNGTVASLIAAFQASNLASAFLVQQNGNEVTFTLNPYPYYQWYLDNTGVDDVSIVCIQEAIPTNLAGPLKDIGSYDLLGDLFVFSTSQDNPPTESDLVVNNVTLGGPLTVVTFTSDHGFALGNWIRITNSEAPWLNGIFLVQGIPSSTQVQIVTDSAWGATHAPFTVGSETVTINPTGIGEIGVAQKDDNTDSWTYTRLLRSVELNFVSTEAIDSFGEKVEKRTSLYFDDNYNTSKVFYYYGEYAEDGAIGADNFYKYDSINKATFLPSIRPHVGISLKEQLNTGGDIPSGYIRYFAVLIDYFGNSSKPSDLSSGVITYSDQASGTAIGNNSEQESTGKVNILTVYGIDNNVYEKVRLGYYLNVDGVSKAFLMREEVLNVNSTDITHDGYGEEESFDVGELATNYIQEYQYAKSLRSIGSRLVRANLRKRQLKDLTKFAKTFKHRIMQRWTPCSSISSPANEYQSPINGFENVGYMLNETYRISMRGKIKETGEMTPWFWVDDIKVDPSVINNGNPNDNRRNQVPHVGDNTTLKSLLVDYNLTADYGNSFPTNRWAKIPYIEFSGMDTGFLIDGIPVSDFIENIEFGRAEVIPEVLCTGVATMSMDFGINNLNPNNDYDTLFFFQGSPAYTISVPASSVSPSTREYFWVYGPPMKTENGNNSYPFSGGNDLTPIYEYPSSTATPIVPSNITPSQTWFSNRRLLSLYSPDIIMNKVSDISGYDFLDFGEMLLPLPSLAPPDADYTASSSQRIRGLMFSQYSVYFPENMLSSPTAYPIDSWEMIEPGEEKIIADGKVFHKGFGIMKRFSGSTTNNNVENSHKNIRGPVIYVGSGGGVVGSGNQTADYGVKYFQLFKERPNKYGTTEKEDYYTTGMSYRITEAPIVNGLVDLGYMSVFGGDTMTQLTYMKSRYVDGGALSDSGFESWKDAGFGPNASPGFGGGMKFYSQNRVNSQMRSDDDTQIVYLSDTTNLTTWLEENNGLIDRLTYSSKYTPELPFSLKQPSYGTVIEDELFFPQRLQYSDKKLQSSKDDPYKKLLPLNIHDLDRSFGEINSIESINGDLFTIQERKYEIQAFNPRGQLQSDINSVEILLKSGDVFSQDGKTLSSYGTQHKWSCIKGYNVNGKDVLYWFNAENGLMMRFGEDGTRVISDRGMIAFFSNFTKWVKDKHEHAFEQGVRGVWDDRRKEAIWTFTGWRNIPQWTNSGVIPVQTLAGTVIANSNAPADTYEEFPRFFRCTVAHTASSATEPGVGADWEDFWEQILYTDYNYYSIFTICFNEQTNGFRCFYGHIPKTYLRWQNSFLSSHPVHRNLIFEHRLGEPTTWYGVDGLIVGNIAPKIEDATVEMVVNELPEQSIRGVAVEYLTERAPDRIDYSTSRQRTYDEAAQFEQRDDQWFAPIRNDITDTGDPEGDGAVLSGDYLRVKFTIFGGTYNLLHSIVVKIRDRFRRFNR